MEKKRFKKLAVGFKEYIIITIGLFLYTAGWAVFIIPNHMVGGGVSGISALIQYATQSLMPSTGGFPLSYSFFLINMVLLAIALKVLGKGFGFKTVYAIFAASLFFRVLPDIIPQELIQELAVSNGKLICTIFGGACAGVGIGITFSQGGSTGGTDIIALMISKYRSISPGKLLLSMDIVIIASSLLLPSEEGWGVKLANVLYGYIMVAVCSSSLDLFLSGTRQSVQIFVFSKKYDQIADKITKELHRGVTVLEGEGWFSKEKGKVLLTIVRKTETNLFFKVIKEIDKNAFMSVGNVMGVYGQGFDQIKK